MKDFLLDPFTCAIAVEFIKCMIMVIRMPCMTNLYLFMLTNRSFYLSCHRDHEVFNVTVAIIHDQQSTLFICAIAVDIIKYIIIIIRICVVNSGK